MSRTSWTVAVIAIVALAIWLFLLRGPFSRGVGTGSALNRLNHTGIGLQKMPVGQEFTVVAMSLRNVSSSPVVIDKVSVIEKLEGIARVVRFSLTDGGNKVTYGTYAMDPPIEVQTDDSGDETCVVQDLVPVSGYRLPPHQSDENAPSLVAHVRTEGVGGGELVYARIHYTQDGQRFVQDIPFTLVFKVKKDARPYVPYRFERRCLNE